MTGHTNAGGGGLSTHSAVLVVTAPSGSTVTASKSGVTARPKVWPHGEDGARSDYVFTLRSTGTWTITAALGGDTATTTIAVDAAAWYTAELSYRVPTEYQAVEYLRATGTQWLVTGVYPRQIASGHVRVRVNAYSSRCTVFGMGQDTSSHALALTQAPHLSAMALRYNGTNWLGPLWDDTTWHDVSFALSDGAQTVTVDGVTYTAAYAGTPTDDIALALFATNEGGSYNYFLSGDIAELSFADATGAALCDLVACYRKADSKPGMWDRVSKTLLVNQGSGDFAVGGDL